MKQYGKRFTYFVSLLVWGYLFWGCQIYIHWPIKWPLGIFNGGAAWSLLALANVCLCVIEYFMAKANLVAKLYWFLVLHQYMNKWNFVKVSWTDTIFKAFQVFIVKCQHWLLYLTFTTVTCVYRGHLSVDCFYFVVNIYPLFQQTHPIPDEFLSFVLRVLASNYLHSSRDSFT